MHDSIRDKRVVEKHIFEYKGEQAREILRKIVRPTQHTQALKVDEQYHNPCFWYKEQQIILVVALLWHDSSRTHSHDFCTIQPGRDCAAHFEIFPHVNVVVNKKALVFATKEKICD